jgi:hypothetical protein
VAADADPRPLRAVHGDRGVPPDPPAVRALGLLVAGEPRLAVRRDRVHVVRAGQRRHPDVALAGALEHPQHEVAGALLPGGVEDGVERVEPFGGLVGVGVGQVGGQPVPDDRDPHPLAVAPEVAALPAFRTPSLRSVGFAGHSVPCALASSRAGRTRCVDCSLAALAHGRLPGSC